MTNYRYSIGLLRLVLSKIPFSVAVLNLSGRIEFCNDRMMRLLGRQNENIMKKDFFLELVPEEERNQIRVFYEEAMRRNKIFCQTVFEVVTKDGKKSPMQWFIILLAKKVCLIGEMVGNHKLFGDCYDILSNLAPLGFYIIQDSRFKFVGLETDMATGYDKEDLLSRKYEEIIHPDDRESVRDHVDNVLKTKKISTLEYRILHCNGQVRWVMDMVVSIVYNGRPASLVYIIDSSERKMAEQALKESGERYRAIFENTGTAMMMFDDDCIITMGNRELEKLSGYTLQEVINQKSWIGAVMRQDLERLGNYHRLRESEYPDIPKRYECDIITKYGERKQVIATVAILPGSSQRIVSLIDITHRKQIEEQLRYFNLHDRLTDTYNRTYFETELTRLENSPRTKAALIICDVDGLKVVNDAFGSDAGDRLLVSMAGILARCTRRGDMVARIGGDEFAVLMPGADGPEVEASCRRIRDAVEEYNEDNSLPLNVSLGFSARHHAVGWARDLFRDADNNMYREKLHRGNSSRSHIVDILMKALEARDFITEGHAERLQELVVGLARSTGWPEREMADLRLLAQMHDIGKVGVPDSILFKPGPLTPQEMVQIQKHSEIGHRIASSIPELFPVADWILKHHERWDGGGYPFGAGKKEIPLACRILALVDAYDAMTSNRPYRKAMQPELAIAEIRRCSGIRVRLFSGAELGM